MPPKPKTVRLFLLGSPRLEHGGRPMAVDTRKAIALIAYLALTRERQARDKLAAFFWPDADGAKALAALRRTLSALNTALSGAGLDIEREVIGVRPDVWVDVNEFLRLSSPANDLRALEQAATLYRDDFLAGFTLRDSPAFDDWQFFQGESLRRTLAGVLERLVGGYSERREFEPAIAHARRWLALDPLQEPAHRRLMQLYEWAGQHSAALRQYQDCQRTLSEELGVTPLEETTRLYETIKQRRLARPVGDAQPQAAARAPDPGAARPAAPPPAYPLVGRSTEWQALLDAYDVARISGRLVVLEGEAGIGKTRLAEAFLRQLQPAGAEALFARCYAGQTSLAYGPFVEALRAAARRPDGAARLALLPAHHRAEAARLLPELAREATPLAALDGPGAQSRFFEGVRQAILALCAGPAPGVFFLDDAQWADEACLDLLAYLVRRVHEQPIFVLVTWRSEDVPAHHRLRLLLGEAHRAGTARALSLGRLQAAEVRTLAQAAGVAAALVDRLYRETEGSPLFVVEYLGALARRADVDGDWPLPAGVRELLGARLATVGETGQQLLATAAVIGRSFDLDTLQAASGRSEDETVMALEELMARGLVAEVAQPAAPVAYDFSHEKLRALAYDLTSLARRRLLHRRVAETLVARARGRQDAGRYASQIAQHFHLGGREAEAAEHFRRAGDYARSVYANAEALTHYRAAQALGHPEAAALHEAIGDLMTLAGDYGAALTSYETAAATIAPEALPGLEHKLANVYDRRGEWDLAETHFQAALGALGEGGAPDSRARLYADWSRAAQHGGRSEQALGLANQALALAEAAGDARALARTHNILGLVASHQRDYAEARAHLEQSLKLAEALNDPDARVAALNNLALACREDGDAARAVALTEAALRLCASLGDRHRQAALHNNLADLFHAQGQGEAAMRHLKQAVALFAEIGAGRSPDAPAWQPEIWKLTEW